MAISVRIDKLTGSVEHSATGRMFPTTVVQLTESELVLVSKKAGWQFNWSNEIKSAKKSIYKLVTLTSPAIQGLVSFEVMDKHIEMHLIESAPHNRGKQKTYLGVPGNLVAFLCKSSFELGFEGFVAFTAKTALIEHYRRTLGAERIKGNRMMIPSAAAKNLINSYYEDHSNP